MARKLQRQGLGGIEQVEQHADLLFTLLFRVALLQHILGDQLFTIVGKRLLQNANIQRRVGIELRRLLRTAALFSKFYRLDPTGLIPLPHRLRAGVR